ncbi:DUF202 domain-containing protein [Enterovibrio sp. ZSDZ35]|uniref:DUF202 domain-containing protein n=1 Tax=Enterovibrio qingdaonensis TaxID=2899818 RepID=A0ABT5QQA9_9GAMM|nr:DUF202 domain-containing protein [Enterovibrio sp. ZSDZ35]MDD1782789.1 DUF202 domain-containing protein [Enterovibrio sp. ZSDZ35]
MSKVVERDPGLQRERSQLAWTRTSLALATAVMLLLKLSVLSTIGMISLIVVSWIALNSSMMRKNMIAISYNVTNRRELIRKLLLSGFVVLLSATAFTSFVFL